MTFVLVLAALVLAVSGNQEAARTLAFLSISVSILEGANVIRKLLILPLPNVDRLRDRLNKK